MWHHLYLYMFRNPKCVSGADLIHSSFGCSPASCEHLRFYCSLWPSAIASFCRTWLPRVVSSSPWSRGMSDVPSMVPSWLPNSEAADWMGNKKERWDKGGRKTEKWSHKRERQHDRQVEWQKKVISTSLWFHIMWVQTSFDCYCILATNTGGDICNGIITDRISTREEKSPDIFWSISLPKT